MRQRLNNRRPRHTERYARPQRRESSSAKFEASVSAAIPLAAACRYLDTGFKWSLQFSGLDIGKEVHAVDWTGRHAFST